MSSFGEKVVSKLDQYIPEAEKQTFKTISIKCLREGGPSGLQKLKSEIGNLPERPGEDVVKEIEDIFNDHIVNTLSFVYQNKQAAAIASVLTKMADKIYLEAHVPTEEKSKVMEDTRKLLNKLQSGSRTNLNEEMITEVLQHNEALKSVASGFDSIKDATFDLAETVKELTSTPVE